MAWHTTWQHFKPMREFEKDEKTTSRQTNGNSHYNMTSNFCSCFQILTLPRIIICCGTRMNESGEDTDDVSHCNIMLTIDDKVTNILTHTNIKSFPVNLHYDYL